MFYETFNHCSIWKFCSMFYETFIHYSVSKFCSIFLFNLEVWRIYIHYSKCPNSKCSLFIFFFEPLFSIHYSASIAPRSLTLRYFCFIFNEPFLAFKVSLNRKVEAIIECFLDSATPPWLQVCGSFVIEDFRHLMGRVVWHSYRTSCTQDCFRVVTRFQVKLKDSLYIKWKKPNLNQQVNT